MTHHLDLITPEWDGAGRGVAPDHQTARPTKDGASGDVAEGLTLADEMYHTWNVWALPWVMLSDEATQSWPEPRPWLDGAGRGSLEEIPRIALGLLRSWALRLGGGWLDLLYPWLPEEHPPAILYKLCCFKILPLFCILCCLKILLFFLSAVGGFS